MAKVDGYYYLNHSNYGKIYLAIFEYCGAGYYVGMDDTGFYRGVGSRSSIIKRFREISRCELEMVLGLRGYTLNDFLSVASKKSESVDTFPKNIKLCVEEE